MKRSFVITAAVIAVSMFVAGSRFAGISVYDQLLALHGKRPKKTFAIGSANAATPAAPQHPGMSSGSQESPKPDSEIKQTDKFPDTPAGKVAKAYVEAFSAGEKQMRDFITKNISEQKLKERPLEARLTSYRSLKERLGSLKLFGIVFSSPNELELRLIDSSGEKKDFTFELESKTGKLLKVSFKEMRESMSH